MREKLHDQGPDNAAIPDADNDFLPDEWETQYFTNTVTATSLSGDNDGDTFTNQQEYVAGSNPNSASSNPGDVDADGLADAWEITYFGNITAQNGSGDPDADGLTNRMEFFLGSDPTTGAEAMLLPSAQLAGDASQKTLSLEFQRQGIAREVFHQVQFSQSLQPGSWTPVAAPAQTITYDPATGDRTFRTSVDVTGLSQGFLRLALP